MRKYYNHYGRQRLRYGARPRNISANRRIRGIRRHEVREGGRSLRVLLQRDLLHTMTVSKGIGMIPEVNVTMGLPFCHLIGVDLKVICVNHSNGGRVGSGSGNNPNGNNPTSTTQQELHVIQNKLQKGSTPCTPRNEPRGRRDNYRKWNYFS